MYCLLFHMSNVDVLKKLEEIEKDIKFIKGVILQLIDYLDFRERLKIYEIFEKSLEESKKEIVKLG